MKALLLTLSLFASLASAEEIRREYDEVTEKQCHQELKILGCVSGQTEGPKCAELQKHRLSSGCRDLFEMKKKK